MAHRERRQRSLCAGWFLVLYAEVGMGGLQVGLVGDSRRDVVDRRGEGAKLHLLAAIRKDKITTNKE